MCTGPTKSNNLTVIKKFGRWHETHGIFNDRHEAVTILSKGKVTEQVVHFQNGATCVVPPFFMRRPRAEKIHILVFCWGGWPDAGPLSGCTCLSIKVHTHHSDGLLPGCAFRLRECDSNSGALPDPSEPDHPPRRRGAASPPYEAGGIR